MMYHVGGDASALEHQNERQKNNAKKYILLFHGARVTVEKIARLPKTHEHLVQILRCDTVACTLLVM